MSSLNLQLSKIISFFKISYKNKYLLVKYKKNKLLGSILENFLRENVIHGFFEDSDYYHIYLKYNNLGEPIIKDLKIFYKRPFELHFTVAQLRDSQFVVKYMNSHNINLSFCLFSTNKGILSYSECLKFNTGGVLLLFVKCV